MGLRNPDIFIISTKIVNGTITGIYHTKLLYTNGEIKNINKPSMKQSQK